MADSVDEAMMYDSPFGQPTPNDSSADWKAALLYIFGPLALLALGLIGNHVFL